MNEGRSEANSPASSQLQQECQDVKFFNTVGNRFITGHNNAIKFWTMDRATSKLTFMDCQLAQNKRFINCITIDPTDTYCYCGTRTGDILEIFIDTASYKRTGPVHKIFRGGIH